MNLVTYDLECCWMSESCPWSGKFSTIIFLSNFSVPIFFSSSRTPIMHRLFILWYLISLVGFLRFLSFLLFFFFNVAPIGYLQVVCLPSSLILSIVGSACCWNFLLSPPVSHYIFELQGSYLVLFIFSICCCCCWTYHFLVLLSWFL